MLGLVCGGNLYLFFLALQAQMCNLFIYPSLGLALSIWIFGSYTNKEVVWKADTA